MSRGCAAVIPCPTQEAPHTGLRAACCTDLLQHYIIITCSTSIGTCPSSRMLVEQVATIISELSRQSFRALDRV